MPMPLPALEDIDARTGSAEPIEGSNPNRAQQAGEGHPDHHGDDALGVIKKHKENTGKRMRRRKRKCKKKTEE